MGLSSQFPSFTLRSSLDGCSRLKDVEEWIICCQAGPPAVRGGSRRWSWLWLWQMTVVHSGGGSNRGSSRMSDGHGQTPLRVPRLLVLEMHSGALRSGKDEEPDC